ncbi:MAG TPA: radical SAM protein, partial [Magnetospirillaceae bacterium]|nr:radical SAM protein [Magnetospirillaceae bacterium]
IEANPGNLDAEMLTILQDAGVDRISLGYQSGETEALREAGRSAGAGYGRRALQLLSDRWQGRFSVDLMIGLPGQTPRGVREDILLAAAAGAEHLSVYELTVEDGTPLDAAVRERRVVLPAEEIAEELWDTVLDACAEVGLKRYEVSNWAKPGGECRHNQNYWRGGAWIGAGPSGVSSLPLADGGTLRIPETKDHTAFLLDAGAEAVEEDIPPSTAAFEAIMTAFRTREGLDAGAFTERFGLAPVDLLDRTFSRWRRYLRTGARGPAPTDRLMDVLNPFLVDCMRELERSYPGPRPVQGG